MDQQRQDEPSSNRVTSTINRGEWDTDRVVVLPLSYVEIRPVLFDDTNNSNDPSGATQQQPSSSSPPPLTSAFIKHQLIQYTSRAIQHQTPLSSSLLFQSGLLPMRNEQQQQQHRNGNISIKNSTLSPIQPVSTIFDDHRTGSHRHTKFLLSGSLIWLSDNGDNDNGGDDDDHDNDDDDRIWFRTNLPFGTNTEWPCYCYGYTIVEQQQQQQHPIDMIQSYLTTTSLDHHHQKQQQDLQHYRILVTESTLVVLLPPKDNNCNINLQDLHLWKDQLTGEVPINKFNDNQNNDENTKIDVQLHLPIDRHNKHILQSHNRSTILELSFRIKQMLKQQQQQLLIGTTSNIYQIQQQQMMGRQLRKQFIRASIQSSISCKTTTRHSIMNDHNEINYRKPKHEIGISSYTRTATTVLHDIMLLVHSPDYGDDKVGLVEAIVDKLSIELGPIKIHTIQPGPLFAKYGLYADIALQSIVHTIILQAAIRKESICIIFDHFDCFISKQNNTSDFGDAATPILQSILSYIRTLLISMQTDRVIPFPRNNPLYNSGRSHVSSSGGDGMLLPVNVCLIAIMTCPDTSSFLRSNDDMNMPGMGLYRISELTSETRIKAMRYALEQDRIGMTQHCQSKVDVLAASAIWLRGRIFQQIAKQVRLHRLQYVLHPSDDDDSSESDHAPLLEATLADIAFAFRIVQTGIVGMTGCDVQFLADDVDNGNAANQDDLFSMVGGNDEAKASLEDALCFDSTRRSLLSSFGVTPSTGLLLYGPPGTGKTLLAKAVAKMLRSNEGNSSPIGGAFITLNSSDIVRSEVGESEKLVVRAFQTARSNSPAVIFIDEFQALFTERSSSGSSNRLTTTLLQCMDDINRWGKFDQGKGRGTGDAINETRVLVLAATNTPWMIDRSFLRPGRFDRCVLVNLPSHKERVSILQLLIRKMKTSFIDDKPDHQINFLERLAARTDGFSGADLAALCRNAAIRCLLEESDKVLENHFLATLDDGLAASSSVSLVERIQHWHP